MRNVGRGEEGRMQCIVKYMKFVHCISIEKRENSQYFLLQIVYANKQFLLKNITDNYCMAYVNRLNKMPPNGEFISTEGKVKMYVTIFRQEAELELDWMYENFGKRQRSASWLLCC